MIYLLDELYKDIIELKFGRETYFYKKVSCYAPHIYNYMLLLCIPNSNFIFKSFLYKIGQSRKLLQDSRTFKEGKINILEAIKSLKNKL